MGKNNCPICNKTTNAVASNKVGALKCSICEFWCHPPCVQVDEPQLDLIKKCEEMGMGSPWSCSVCRSAVDKLDKSVKQIASRVTVIESKTESLEKSAEELKKENKHLKEEMVKIKEKVTKNGGVFCTFRNVSRKRLLDKNKNCL